MKAMFMLSILFLGIFPCNASVFRLPVVRKRSPRTPRIAAESLGVEDIPVPFSGNFPKDGEFYLNLTIGTQDVSLLIDTGSSDLGLSAAGCKTCAKKNHLFYAPKKSPNATVLGCNWCETHENKDTSSSCKKRPDISEKQCTFRVSYADDSGFSAALWKDDISFGEKLTTRSVVGAMYTANFPNPRSVDGIIGLADLSVSSSGATTPFADLVADGKVEDVFSLCLTEDGGVMYFGDGILDELPNRDDVVWVPRVPTSGFYAVDIKDVTVNGTSIGVPPKTYNDGDAIVDSGTSDTCFSASAFRAIKENLEGLCTTTCLKGVCNCDDGKPLKNPIFENRCVALTKDERKSYPTIAIDFANGASVNFDPDFYLQGGDVLGCDDGEYTISISSCGPDGSGTILGDSLMMQYVVIHDRRENPSQRIGFVQRSGEQCP
eukprot:g1316.t1